ncbi:MAG: uncharacterized membrane protein YbhN (UPF0104 family) [Myxococcota bacterium]|jgi:uncharacterized membrane protein YbhN (UPF0104 family)
MTIAAVAWIGSRIEPGEALDHLRAAPAWAYLVPIVLMLINAWIHAVRVQILLSAIGVSARQSAILGAILRAGFIGLVLPTGGSEVAKVAWLTRVTGESEAAVTALVGVRVLELLPWAGLLIFGLSRGLLTTNPLIGASALFFAIAFLGVVGLTAIGARSSPALARRIPGRVGDFAVRCALALSRVKDRPGHVLAALLLAVPFALINCLSILVALRGHGIGLSYVEVLALFPAADTLISLPVTISGVGVREGVFAHALAPWGVAESLAVAASLTRWTGELGRAAVGGILFVIRDPAVARR